MESTRTKKKTTVASRKKPSKKDVAASYNQRKEFGGQQYTGMKIGGHHKWYYDKGEWKESKITPDVWRINYNVTKRRAGKAPQGSGAKVGTGYQWYILAHQRVEKLNADDYTTAMTGLKFKLSHKRAGGNWSASAAKQRKQLITFLKDMLHELEKNVIELDFEYNGQKYKGEAIPVPGTCFNGACFDLDITLNTEHLGIIRSLKSGWKLDSVKDQKLVKAISEIIMAHYK
jgi:hypothetical protein